MELSEELAEQRDLFIHYLTEDPENLYLHPFVDSHTKELRLGICGATEDESLYLIGVLLLNNDTLYNRLEPYSLEDSTVEKPRMSMFGWVRKFLNRS